MNDSFWFENPSILFRKDKILRFWPYNTMSFEEKLNATTRFVIGVSLFGFMLLNNYLILLFGIVLILSILFLYMYMKKQIVETLDNQNLDDTNKFTKENPLYNVLMSDYDYNVDKKPAPASYTKKNGEKILDQAKKLVSEANPDHPDIAEKLFSDLGTNLQFEQSMRQFSSNPNTTIPNDQGAFADFCYGSMISCKEGNKFACARNLTRHTNY